MSDDPLGYYALLGVDPRAPQQAVTAAFRRAARVVHPDVPGTGSTAAFLRVREAYDVIGDPSRRAVYDRDARIAAARSRVPTPPPRESALHVLREPRSSDVSAGIWIGLAASACAAISVAVVLWIRLSQLPVSAPPPARVGVVQQPAPTPTPHLPTVQPGGIPTHYVLPSSGRITLWRRDATTDAYRPGGELAAFTPVEVLRLLPQVGLVEIRLADGGTGFVDAARLAPGNAETAHHAACVHNAGPTPVNGEVLTRGGSGPAQLAVENRGSQAAVVKLRGLDGHTASSIFVAASSAATLGNLADQPYRVEFATGDIWSRSCQSFTAAMRAQRLVPDAAPASLSPLSIPTLSNSVRAVDIPDTAFEQE